jgi:hypothetical protein
MIDVPKHVPVKKSEVFCSVVFEGYSTLSVNAMVNVLLLTSVPFSQRSAIVT